MVFSDELGYDPDEWEECPPADHFLVFSPFTRLILSLSAVGFIVVFFWLLDAHKNKGGSKKEEEEGVERVRRVAPIESSSSPASDLFSTLTGIFTGSGRDPDFVQRSFRDEERAPAAVAAAARETASKIEVRPDELSSSFHYNKPDDPKNAADVRAEVDKAAFELRDLLDDGQAPPIPPHRPFIQSPSWFADSLSNLAYQTQDAASDATDSANDFLTEIRPTTLSGVSDRLHDAYDQAAQGAASAYDRAGQAAHDAYDRVAAPAADAYNRTGEAAQDAYNRAGQSAQDAYNRVGEPLAAAQQHTAQLASNVQDGVSSAYDSVAASVPDAFDRVGQTTQEALGRTGQAPQFGFGQVGRKLQDVNKQAAQAAQDTYDQAAQGAASAYDRAGQTAQDAYQRAEHAVSDNYDRAGQSAHDVYDRAAEPLATAQHNVAQFATATKDGASEAYDRVAAPVSEAFDRTGSATRDAYNRAGQQSFDRGPATPTTPVAGAYAGASQAFHDAFDRVGQSAQQQAATAQQRGTDAYDQAAPGAASAYDRAGQAAHDAYDRAAAPTSDAYNRTGQAVHDAYDRAAAPAADAYERAQAAAARITDTETARLEDDFERVQRDLDNLMAEHQVPLGVIIPGSSTSSTPAVSASRQYQQQQATSPMDEHVRQLTAGLLTSDAEQERTHSSDIPSLHDIYEERQRQMSPPMVSPVKIPTMEDRAALQHWEEELARKEQEKLEKLVDTIVGGDDISDIAGSEGTEHLLPGDRISMYSQDSAAAQHLQHPQMQPLRRSDETEALPASAKINQKIDQISSALEQSLLSEIEQLARQTSTMQAELARARDSEYSADEVSEGVHDPRLDAFQPAGDVRFIPAHERADQAAPISHRNSERQSGESDDFVKITPPSHSGAPSPSPAPVCMSSSEEEQLKRLVEEYDVIGSTSTLKKDASAPGALGAGAVAAAAHPAEHSHSAQPQPHHHQQQQPLPSPTTAALLHEYETVQSPQQQQQQQGLGSPLSAYQDSPLHPDEEQQFRQQQVQQQHGQQQYSPSPARLSAEEQAQLDQVLRDFEMTPGSGRKDVLNRPLPRTPPHTPENTLCDPFGRPIQGLPEMPEYMISGEMMSPTTEITLPLAPRRSIGDLRKTFPGLPAEASIEVVDPAETHLPRDVVLPHDLEDVLASLVNVDSTELFLPSQPPPDPAVAATAHAAANLYLETPILSSVTPDQSKKESVDSFFGERKPTVIAAPVQQLLQQQASLDLSQPLQPPMAAFDRPQADGAAKPAVVNADFVVRQAGYEDEPYAQISMKPQMMPAFDPKIRKPTASASTTVPHDELAKADAMFQDALDYMDAQKQPARTAQQPQATGFIMEEDMLSSHGENAPRRPERSADGTSKLIKTNEIFERLDPHDDHDDMTYAPEIQSVEIPPDQMSETSELPHEDLPIDDIPLFKSPEAQKLEAEIRAQESAMDEAKSAMQHRAALAQAPHIISVNPKHQQHPRFPSTPSISSAGGGGSPKALRKQSSLLSILGVTSTQEMLLKIDSLEALSNAMRKAGLDSTNVIFGIDYTASNKYQGEESFGGHSLHTIHPNLKNPYQQVITILGRTLAPFTTTNNIPVYGFGDAKTSDWSVFSLKDNGHCTSLEEVLKTYNEITPTIELSGPTNFSPLIYQAIEICQRTREYHILVIIADGQVTNEKATRRAIVQACQYPLSIIVVGVGDGPWDMMRVFDESLPKRPWDNFHFVEFHEVVKRASGAADGDVKVAIQSLLEIPDQYRCVCNLGLLKGRSPSITHKNSPLI